MSTRLKVFFLLLTVLGLLDNPLVNYLIRLQQIYTLDLEVLDRLIALLKGVNVEVIPGTAFKFEEALSGITILALFSR